MWQYSVATIVKANKDKVTIRCPHCDGEHEHSKLSMGSKEVIAGCHRGYKKSRSYAIPRR